MTGRTLLRLLNAGAFSSASPVRVDFPQPVDDFRPNMDAKRNDLDL